MAKTAKKDDKVMDVSKPGASAPDASSRPVIVGHRTILQDPMVKSAETDESKEENVIVSTTAPTIKPISGSKSTAVEVKTDTPESTKAEKPVEPEPEVEAKPAKIANPAVVVQTDEPKDEPEKTDEPSEPPEESKDEAETKPASKSESSESDEAVTNAVAAQAANKTTEKEDKEAVAKMEAVEKLVTDKTYNLPIGEAKRKRNMSLGVLILLLIVAAALLYLAIDAEIIKTSIKLPIEFIK